MTTKLHPDLLRACAAYLAHAETYCLDGDDQMALLRAGSRDAIVRGLPLAPVGVTCSGPTDAQCDELTHAHLEAIRRTVRDPGDRTGREMVARAILDATPAMLKWWCVRLAR